ncbi:hypothetical protein SAMN05192541_1842 [Bradyrhizobium arachidis]|nr:hypothetical protein SAMN05192541_1842 [Bradyrhizobium arachidis]
MSTTETGLLIVLAGLVVLILANIAFQVARSETIPRSASLPIATASAFTISNEAMPPRLAWSCFMGMAPWFRISS